MKVWNLFKGGVGEGSNPKSKLFGIHFGSIEIEIWGRFRAIDPYFWIQTLGGWGSTKSLDEIHTFNFFLNEDLPKWL